MPDDVGKRFKGRAAEEGISQSDWIRNAVEAALISSSSTDALREAIDRADRAEADLAAAGIRIAVLEAVAVEKDARIEDLQKTIATIAAPTPPPAIPETAGPGRSWLGRQLDRITRRK